MMEASRTKRTITMVTKTYGTLSAARRKALNGLEFVQGLVSGALPLMPSRIPWATTWSRPREVVVTSVPTGAHLNPWGSPLATGFSNTTLEFKISLIRPITPETGSISAEAKVLNGGRHIGTAEGRVTDSTGRLLAHGTTTCLIFPS